VGRNGSRSTNPFSRHRDDVAFRGLSVRERLRVTHSMARGRPLPPKLARVAGDHATYLQSWSFIGYFELVLGVLFLAGAAAGQADHRMAGWLRPLWWVLAVGWLSLGAYWLLLVSRAKRAVRDGYWPEQMSSDPRVDPDGG